MGTATHCQGPQIRQCMRKEIPQDSTTQHDFSRRGPDFLLHLLLLNNSEEGKAYGDLRQKGRRPRLILRIYNYDEPFGHSGAQRSEEGAENYLLHSIPLFCVHFPFFVPILFYKFFKQLLIFLKLSTIKNFR